MRKSPTYHSYQVSTPYGLRVPVRDAYEIAKVRAQIREPITLDKLEVQIRENRGWKFKLYPSSHKKPRYLALDSIHAADLTASLAPNEVIVCTMAELRERMERHSAEHALRILAGIGGGRTVARAR